ncbi:MAG: sugar phosphate isomerase/epimerase family protein [Vicinamibacterales bacterium]
MDRRTFLLATAAAFHTSRVRSRSPAAHVELGSIDGSVGGNNFTPTQFLDYLGSIKLTWAMLSLPAATLSDEAALRGIREHADRLGIRVQLAFGSICPSARSFNPQLGTLEEQVGRALKASQIFGATCMRCIVGGDPERPQIDMHIDNTIKAIRAIHTRIADSGIKLAVENHGGDLQAREMKMMIDAIGRDIMGVCLDSGNPVWMLEDPHMTLEILVPYAETCHVRDSAVWKVPEGIAVRWVNMGEGNVDIDGWIRKFIQAKPGMPIIFENLVSANPRIHAIYNPQFWDNWRKMPAWELSRFLAIAEKGTPKPATPRPEGKTAGQQRIDDLEVCVRYTRDLLQRI